jgi:hypothetical protein
MKVRRDRPDRAQARRAQRDRPDRESARRDRLVLRARLVRLAARARLVRLDRGELAYLRTR